jgi:unsaturated rhamnogalacturonyl hydrolase
MRASRVLRRFAAVCVLTGSVLPATPAAAATMPGRDQIRVEAFRVGDHYRAAVPCSASGCAITNHWDDGVLIAGVVEVWRTFSATAYRSYATDWANRQSWRLYSNTSGNQRDPNFHNRMMAGYAYIRLSEGGVAGASLADVRANLEARLAMPLTQERIGLTDHVFPGKTDSSFSWKAVDAEFMALPVWTMMGRKDGRAPYHDRGRELQDYQVDIMGLQDPVTKLWYRDEAEKSLLSPNGRKVVWGRGAGWIAAALAATLEELPTARAEYAEYRMRFIDLMAAARTRQRADGFWNMNVEDPQHYPAPEASATALLAYAAAKGVKLGILDRETYEPMAAKA